MTGQGARAKELFLVPVEPERYLLYAPLRRAVAVVNSGAAGVVARYIENEEGTFSAAEQAIIDRLTEDHLLGGEEPAPPAFPENYAFAPYEVTLFLTSRCNLRCRYCYAEGGTQAKDLTWAEARAAIDLVARNASLGGRGDFIVGFHGGGEPTLAWPMMVRCVEHAQERAAATGLTAHIHTATNGILSDEQLDYIVAHFTGVNVSFDGPPDIQNHNRPFADGRGSYDPVMRTLMFLDARRFSYGIRATVTSDGAPRMAEIVEFLGTRLPALKQVHIEPLWYCGRCHTSGEVPPSPEAFVSHYTEAQRRAAEIGVHLSYSGARLDSLTNRFCAAPGEGFSVVPGGRVTSCFEVCDTQDPRAAWFHYGRFDWQAEQYVFDEEMIGKLRGLSVEHLGFCGDCFCKWHCAGDCLAKALQGFGAAGHQGSLRCGINRALTLVQLQDLLGEARQREGHHEQTQ